MIFDIKYPNGSQGNIVLEEKTYLQAVKNIERVYQMKD